MAIEEMTNHEEQTAQAEVQMTVGDTPAAAETPVVKALKWFEVVEVPEVGFKAFCRLPNDFQHKDIREKAMAAKARRIRALRNPGTDAFEVLDSELQMIAEMPDALENLVSELVSARYFSDRDEAIADVREQEEFEHIYQDQERFRELDAMDPEKRPEDEWKTLVAHIASYAQAVERRLAEIQEPQKEALRNLGLNDVLDKVREARTDADSRSTFMDTYSFWQMYVGTLVLPEGFDPDNITPKTTPHKRYFASESDLREADPAIVSRLRETFETLETNLASLTSGNS